MNQYIFLGLVRKHFQYLNEEFGFDISEYYDAQYENFSVGFERHNTLLSFSYDRGDVYIVITNLLDPQRRGHDPGTAIKFSEPKSYEVIKATGFPRLPDKPFERVDMTLNYWAPLIRQYLKPILTGEFAQWSELDQFESKALAEFKERELPRILEQVRKENLDST